MSVAKCDQNCTTTSMHFTCILHKYTPMFSDVNPRGTMLKLCISIDLTYHVLLGHAKVCLSFMKVCLSCKGLACLSCTMTAIVIHAYCNDVTM